MLKSDLFHLRMFVRPEARCERHASVRQNERGVSARETERMKALPKDVAAMNPKATLELNERLHWRFHDAERTADLR